MKFAKFVLRSDLKSMKTIYTTWDKVLSIIMVSHPVRDGGSNTHDAYG